MAHPLRYLGAVEDMLAMWVDGLATEACRKVGAGEDLQIQFLLEGEGDKT